jgi:GH24 family phage-related lysozyme (muramidase)
MKNRIFRGVDAVEEVERLEGRMLSPIEAELVMEEGYAVGPYLDTKGVATSGVGQTGGFQGKPFGEVFQTFEQETRKLIPAYDSLPEYAQSALMLAAYRGDLQQSPKFRRLFNAGEYEAAADEFLNNDDYRQAKKRGTGVAKRMEKVAERVRRLASPEKEEKGIVVSISPSDEEVGLDELKGNKNWLQRMFGGFFD